MVNITKTVKFRCSECRLCFDAVAGAYTVCPYCKSKYYKKVETVGLK